MDTYNTVNLAQECQFCIHVDDSDYCSYYCMYGDCFTADDTVPISIQSLK